MQENSREKKINIQAGEKPAFKKIMTNQMTTVPIPEVLENDDVKLVLVKESDFEKIYEIGSDPKVWEQHPNPTRYQKDIFRTFFREL